MGRSPSVSNRRQFLVSSFAEYAIRLPSDQTSTLKNSSHRIYAFPPTQDFISANSITPFLHEISIVKFPRAFKPLTRKSFHLSGSVGRRVIAPLQFKRRVGKGRSGFIVGGKRFEIRRLPRKRQRKRLSSYRSYEHRFNRFILQNFFHRLIFAATFVLTERVFR